MLVHRLQFIRDVCKLVVKKLTNWEIYCADEFKFNKRYYCWPHSSELLNLAERSMHLTKLIDAGRNTTVTEFAVSLLQALVTQALELVSLISTISCRHWQSLLGDVSANASSPSAYMVSNNEKANQSRGRKAPFVHSSVSRGDDYDNVESMTADPPGSHDQVSMLFKKRYGICEATGTDGAAVISVLCHSCSKVDCSNVMI
ncbi:uncharacterized protein LOC113304976 [Papaver somniferum]|uniref:uncharacterized protein LOC113304976 n=1 Tax=Papaver somniferum TaxID=3469 RepID=UPI000E703F5F|nr:uncharacterized protein LOC113304976 [Papaver somniferum]XP_026409881.1 uncharacterized protein LOC113304976 [Papaver somniferum]